MDVHMLTLAGIFAALAMVPWIHIGKGSGRDDGWVPRGTAALFALSAAAFTLAIPAWRDALAAFTAGSGGLGVLTVALIVSGLCFWFQAIHRRKDPNSGLLPRFRRKPKNGVQPQPAAVKPHHRRHHYNRLWTMVVSATFGTAFVLAWVRGKQIIAEIAKSPARYQTALGQFSQQVHNGTATKAMTPAQVHHVLFYGVVIAVVVVLLMRGYERKRHGKPFLLPAKKPAKGGGGGGGRQSIGGGQGALPPGAGGR